MTIQQAVFSGALQGVAEFFPISSTGHLVLLHHYFGFQESQVVFDMFLHVATSLAILIYFWKDFKDIFTKNNSLGFLLLVGCMPTFVIGYIFSEFLEKFFISVKMVSMALIINGILLFIANLVNKRFYRRRHIEQKNSQLTVWKALLIGAAQGIGLIPGISRSGATISTGLLCGLGSGLSFRFSFMVLLPAIAGAVVYKSKYVTASAGPMLPIVAGCLVAFAAGFFTLSVLGRILKEGKIHFFSFYCIALGIATLIW